jgi:aromatic ring-opening dioxygenase LigB subunit
VPGIGNREDLIAVKRGVRAMEELRHELELANPNTIVIISPHAPIERYSFGVNEERTLRGNLRNFGLDKEFEFRNNPEIVKKILYYCWNNNEMPVHGFESQLDHGALVPLYFLTRNIKPHLVHLSFSFMNLKMHFDYGEILGKLLSDYSGDVAIIASGDLSHRLTPGAPAGYSERGEEFDRTLVKLFENNEVNRILELKPDFTEEAGECGLRSFVMLLGMLKEKKYQFKKLSYEGPFGVGYLVARLL